MRFSAYLVAGLPLTYAFSLDRRAACNRDNCLRAVQGTVPASSVSSSRVNTDCSSFQTATYYPPATTTTITSGSTSGTVLPATASTTIRPSQVPAYAQTACSSGNAISSRFSSACSCAGVTQTVITASTPTATVIVPTPTPNSGYVTCPTPFQQPDEDFVYCNGDLSTNGYTCVCYEIAADDKNYCAEPTWPCGKICSVSADCQSTQECILGTYCDGPGTCVDKTYFEICVNGASPARMFKRADGPIVGGLPVSS